MNTINSILKPIEGNLISMSRDTVNGWYVLQIGVPNTWVFDNNKEIECEIVQELDEGKILNIIPKTTKIIVDDLVDFVEIIVKTNERIAAKEKQFTEKMENMKSHLEEEYKKFYEELDELRDSSFQIAGDKFVEKLQTDSKSDEKEKPRGRPKKKKIETLDA